MNEQDRNVHHCIPPEHHAVFRQAIPHLQADKALLMEKLTGPCIVNPWNGVHCRSCKHIDHAHWYDKQTWCPKCGGEVFIGTYERVHGDTHLNPLGFDPQDDRDEGERWEPGLEMDPQEPPNMYVPDDYTPSYLVDHHEFCAVCPLDETATVLRVVR